VQNAAVKAIAEASFSGTIKDDCLVLPGVVSRKKQIIPQLIV
jgi:manganese-dependent inorganic pyrophosphatase